MLLAVLLCLWGFRDANPTHVGGPGRKKKKKRYVKFASPTYTGFALRLVG